MRCYCETSWRETQVLVKDTVNHTDVDTDKEGLLDFIRGGRQVELHFDEVQSDADGYMKWDTEYWSSLDNNRFICTYSLNDKHSSEFTHYNVSDMEVNFRPDQASEVRLS